MPQSKKSALRIGINGMGRIGRLIFRRGFDSLNIQAVNGTSPVEQLSHFLKYDSVHGVWDKSVFDRGGELVVEGRSVPCFQEKTPSAVPWDKHNIDIVIECSGRFKKSSDWREVFSSGVQKVIVSAPAVDPNLTVIYGVNHESYKKDRHSFISTASCTTNCLAPLIKVLKESCGVKRGSFSTVHSYTNDQRLLDSSHKKDLRRARAGGLNIIPTSTGAGQALSLIFPDLKDRIYGLAFRVPTANVSLLDLIVETEKESSLNELHEAFQQAVRGSLKGVLALEEQPLVSSDFIGRGESSILDWPLSCLQDGQLLKLVSWYDNEAGFSSRVIDFIHFMENSDFESNK